jgi:alcohol dehydrogenase
LKSFECIIPTKTIVGAGVLERLTEEVTGMGKKCMIVTYPDTMRSLGFLEKVEKLVKDAGVEVVVDEGVMANPTTTYINDMTETFVKDQCDFIIGLGGGSVIDAAKAIAFQAVNGGKWEDYLPGGAHADLENVKDALPVVAITTTAGTGSEVTCFSVITNEATKEKPGIGHDSLFPRVAFVDPELMTCVPKGVTAATGIDVLFHAMEAYVSNIATPMSDLCAKEAIELVVNNLGEAMNNGENIDARAAMAWANTLAGVSIFQATTVGIHGMGHPIGGHTNAAHGLTMAAIGPAFLRETWDGDVKRHADLTRMFGFDDGNSTEEELAKASGDALEAILKRFEVNISISDLGVKESDIPQLAKDAFGTMEGCMVSTIKELNTEMVERIYKNSL